MIRNRTDLINYLIEENCYESYAEIGTSNPHVHFDHIRCKKKYSIDPGEDCENWGDKTQQFEFTHKMTSDEFFEQNKETFDLIFVDGLHTDVQCSLDIYNALCCINEYGTIAIHDTMPDEEAMTGDEVRKFRWNGNCWMPIYRLIQILGHGVKDKEGKLHEVKDFLEVKSFYLDWGISIIKVLKPLNKAILEGLKFVLIDEPIALNYKENYHQSKMNPIYDVTELVHDKVSYFTPLYKSNVKLLKKVYQALCSQTVNKWEWVCYDDTPNDNKLKIFFETIDDKRVKYYYFDTNAPKHGIIGENKYRVATLCNGKYLAELDHDDIILPEMTERILKVGNKFNADFIYCDSAEIYYDMETDAIKECKRYPEGFGMGYGYYYATRIQNPINKGWYGIQASACRAINPKTLRHIVGVPNHIRCWKREFYLGKLHGHRRMLPIADDYELVVKTVVNNGICVYMNWCGYLQLLHEENTTDERRPLIQEYVKSVRQRWDKEIEEYFEREDPAYGDWCKTYLREHLNDNILVYHGVPNFEKINPGISTPKYPKIIEISDKELEEMFKK